MSDSPGDPVEISIVIPTYKRPEGLARALAGCRNQVGIDIPFEIVVVDNDVDRTASPIVDAFISTASVPVTYVHQPLAGISWARNAGLAAARGRYVAFVDDDEAPVPVWLASFYATLRTTGAAMAAGPVRPVYEQNLVAIPKLADKFYIRDARVPTGTAIEWYAGGNLMVDRAYPSVAERRFDVTLRFGEDAMYLGQARCDGCPIVWCAEAEALETIPAAKTAPDYLLRRSFGGGQGASFFCFRLRPRRVGQGLRWMVIGAGQVLLLGPLALALRVLRRPSWLPVMAKAYSGFGKVLWHPVFHARLYRLARPKVR